MLGDINRDLEPIEYELILCKSDKTQIGVINYEDITYDARFPTTDELSFSINYGENYYDLIKGDYLVLLNDEKYFIIDNPEEVGDGIEIKNIHCYSLEYMLNKKIIRSYNLVSRKLYTLSNDLDEEGYQLGVMNYIKTLTSWKLDTESFLAFENTHTIYRSFDISEKTLFDFLINDVQPAFGCIFLFNTKTKTISVKTIEQLQGNKGLYISEENYIKSINKQIKNDEIRTRLYCYGNDISISDINPTGSPYIENYTFYKDTDYMSQDLINSLNAYEEYLSSLEILTTWKGAILNYVSLPSSGLTIGDTYQITSDVNPDNNGYWRWEGTIWEQININYSILLAQLNIIQIEYTALDNDLTDAEGVLEIAQDAVDMAISTNQSLTQVNIDLDNAEILVSAKQLLVDEKQVQIDAKYIEIINYRNSIDISNYINTEALVEEFDNFIKETTWHDSNYTDSSELLEEGKKKLWKLCTPPLIFDIEIIDFLQIVECQHDWSKLVLGDIVNVEFSKFEIDIWVRLIGYTYKPKDNSLVLSFSNKDSIDDPNIYFKDLISNAITSSTTLNMNKVDWDNKVNPSVITELRNENIDTTLKKVLAGRNQNIITDGRGMWLTEKDEFGNALPEQMRIINNIIALTKDSWQTASLGITPDGVNAGTFWGKTVIANNGLFDGIDIYDGEQNPVVEIGKYNDGEIEKRGIRIKGGSLEIVDGLPEDQINSASTSTWNSTSSQLTDFVTNTYPTDISSIQSQIDGKVDTFYQTTMPHPEYVNVPDNSDYNKFVSDLWYDSTITIKKTYIYTKTANGSNFDYKWSQQEIPKDIFDTIDGKKTIYTLKPTSYQKDDIWILENDTVITSYKTGELLTALNTRATYLETDWIKKVRYTDDTVANQALTDATNANDAITEMASDAKLTAIEKQAVKLQWDAIVAEKPILDSQATTYGVTTEKTAYDNNYTTLSNYITPLLADLTITSDIVGATFRTNFANYYTSKVSLLNKISDVTKAIADNSIQSGINYNGNVITQDGMVVKNSSNNTVVETGEFDKTNHLYGIKATHADGSYTQLSQNGLQRLVAGETIPMQYETHIVTATTVGISNSAWISTSDPQYAIDVALWDEGITLSLPPRFHGKNFQCFLTMKSLEIPIANEGGTVRMVFKAPVLNIDKINGTVNVVGYAFDNAYGLYMYQGIDFNLIVTL